MKILYVVSGTGVHGGATKSFFVMADGIAREGHEIKLIAPDDKGVTELARQRGWEVFVVPYRFCALPAWQSTKDKLMFIPRLIKSVILNTKAHQAVKKFVRSYRPDIVHDNTSVTDIGHFAAKSIDIPHIIHIREYGWKDFRLVLPFLKRRLRYSKAAIIGITDDLRNLRGRFLSPDRQVTIYNGVVRKDKISYDPDKEDTFLFAGRIEHAKGVSDLIDAYIKYAEIVSSTGNNPLRLIMAGSTTRDPELYESLLKKLQSSGLSEKVEWLGEIKEVASYMSKAAATIIPSLWEGFGRVMPEAMANGSLCIARDTGGTSEQLANGRRLFGRDIALSFSDTLGLIKCMLEVDRGYRDGYSYKSGGKFEKIIKDSQKVVENYYLCEEVGHKTLDFYYSVLKQDK
ncbi:MAG: glycosyltransferase [Muribaculaceae bacterium]|nr:glycosyltransferase [Muribaculaceae bacterium]